MLDVLILDKRVNNRSMPQKVKRTLSGVSGIEYRI